MSLIEVLKNTEAAIGTEPLYRTQSEADDAAASIT